MGCCCSKEEPALQSEHKQADAEPIVNDVKNRTVQLDPQIYRTSRLDIDHIYSSALFEKDKHIGLLQGFQFKKKKGELRWAGRPDPEPIIQSDIARYLQEIKAVVLFGSASDEKLWKCLNLIGYICSIQTKDTDIVLRYDGLKKFLDNEVTDPKLKERCIGILRTGIVSKRRLDALLTIADIYNII